LFSALLWSNVHRAMRVLLNIAVLCWLGLIVAVGGSSASRDNGASGVVRATGGSAATSGGGQCADACPHPSGIVWGCHKRFMHGVNYAWEVFAGDFGGISAWGKSGVAGNVDTVSNRLRDMAAHGVDVVRWWVWPDFRGDGVQFDESGIPTGLGPTALADLEMALQLANQHNLHLMLTLFSFDSFRPARNNSGIDVRGLKPIATDIARRAALVSQVVRPLARAAERSPYRDRLIAWDIINEPEWAMTGPSKYCRDEVLPADRDLEHLTHDQMETFVADVIAGLRAESRALVTVGGAAIKWRCAWSKVDIDFYQFHIYEWTDKWFPYDRTPASYGVTDKPVIMGEFPLKALKRASYSKLLDYWYANGWSGALGWAVTDDKFDWNGLKGAVGAFASRHACTTRY
jgi:hypothetical protein